MSTFGEINEKFKIIPKKTELNEQNLFKVLNKLNFQKFRAINILFFNWRLK